MNEDNLIYFGGEIKAVGEGKVSGYLVRFSGPKDTDLTGDFFTAGTDFGITDGASLPVYYSHGLDPQIKARRIGRGLVKFDEVGLWFEAQLEMRDEYEKMIYEMASAGKLGWSSQAGGTLVEREPVGKAYRIKSWPIAEGSLTPTPAEPRNNVVISLKSLSVLADETQVESEAETPRVDVPSVDESPVIEPDAQAQDKLIMENTMENEMVFTPELAKQIATDAADAAVKAYRESAPAPTAPVNIQVTKDEGDKPFRSIAEQCEAVKSFVLSNGQKEHPRLSALKAIGGSEGVPSDGGLLLDPTLSSLFLAPIHDEGPFSNLAKKLPVSGNSNYGYINGVDETSRVAGSRWGGIRGYRLAESATKTASKPTFRRINWELKKYAVVVYSTDELLADAAQFSAVVEQGCREELGFMLNDDIMNGLGLAGPQGFMNSGSLITVTRTTGSKILGEDISAMYNRLDIRGRKNAVWFIGNDSQPQLDNLFAVGSTAVTYPYASIGADGVQRLYGRPIVTSEFNASLNTTGDIVLADMSQYLLWEKGGIESATSIHVAFLTDESVFRFVYRCDGQSSVASALTPYKGTTTTSPFVCLTSAT